MKLIDKDEIVTKIKSHISDIKVSQKAGLIKKRDAGKKIALFNSVLFLLDTLEVKEMKEEFLNKDLEEAICQSFIYHEKHGDDFKSNKQIETAYRCGFETGIKFKTSIIEDIEKQNLEIKEAELEKKIKDYFDNQPIITRSKGVDYQLIPSGEDIAKHFFELGLKAQKGE